jgi:hypothetical protein
MTLEREQLEAQLTALRRRRTPTQAPPPTTAPRLHPLGTPALTPGQPDPARPSTGHRGPPTSPGPHREDGLAQLTHILGTVLQRAGLGNSDNIRRTCATYDPA